MTIPPPRWLCCMLVNRTARGESVAEFGWQVIIGDPGQASRPPGNAHTDAEILADFRMPDEFPEGSRDLAEARDRFGSDMLATAREELARRRSRLLPPVIAAPVPPVDPRFNEIRQRGAEALRAEWARQFPGASGAPTGVAWVALFDAVIEAIEPELTALAQRAAGASNGFLQLAGRRSLTPKPTAPSTDATLIDAEREAMAS